MTTGTASVITSLRVRARDYKLSLRFRDAGDDLIVFAHGLGCSKKTWLDAWQRLEFRDKSLLVFDFPGFGQSPPPPEFSYGLGQQAEIMGALLDTYARRRIHLVAHSMGGSIATLLSQRWLARLASLTLIEARFFTESCGVSAEAIAVTREEFQKSVFEKIKRRLASDPRSAFDFERADTNAFYASSKSLVECCDSPQLLAGFRSAQCPKYYIYGQDNEHLREVTEIGRDLAYPVPDAAHFPMHDNPDAFYETLSRCLDAAERSP